MISKNSFKQALIIAKLLERDGKDIEVKRGSLIDELLKSNIDALGEIPQDLNDDELVDYLALRTESETAEKHENLLNNYTKDLTKYGGELIKHIITTLIKEVKRFNDKYIELSPVVETRPAESFYNVVFTKAPSLANTDFISEMVNSIDPDKGYARSKFNNLESIFEGKEVKDLLLTGVGYVDDLINAWIVDSEITIEKLKEITLGYLKFSDKDILRGVIKAPAFNSIESSLLMLLFWRNLSVLRDEQGETIKDVTVPAYNNFRFWSFAFKRKLTSYRDAIEKGRLISPNGTDSDLADLEDLTKVDGKKKTIVIYEESLYKLEGKNVDATSIFGYIVSGGNYLTLTVDEIVEDAEKYAVIWRSKVDLLNYVERKLNANRSKWLLRKTYHDCFVESFEEAKQEGKFENESDRAINITYIGGADNKAKMEEVDMFVSNLKPDENITVFEAAVALICNVRFNDWETGHYLKNFFTEDNNGFVVNEGRVRETLSNYFADFLLDNIEI